MVVKLLVRFNKTKTRKKRSMLQLVTSKISCFIRPFRYINIFFQNYTNFESEHTEIVRIKIIPIVNYIFDLNYTRRKPKMTKVRNTLVYRLWFGAAVLFLFLFGFFFLETNRKKKNSKNHIYFCIPFLSLLARESTLQMPLNVRK